MAEITAAAVMALREKTGLPMMECKKALRECGGNTDEAVEWLRKQGIKTQALRADRETSCGRLAVFTDPALGVATIIEMRCESPPVAGSPDFKDFCNDIAKTLALGPGANTPEELLAQKSQAHPGQTLAELKADLFNRMREVFELARIKRVNAPCGGYAHHDGSKAALVEIAGEKVAEAAETAKEIAMHVVALSPQGDQAGHAAALHILAADKMARALGRHEQNVVSGRRLHLAEVEVEAVAGHQHRPRLEVRLDARLVNIPLQLVGEEDVDHVSLLDGVLDAERLEAMAFGELIVGSAGSLGHNHLEAAITEVLGLGVPLRAVADDGDGLAGEVLEIGVGVVVDRAGQGVRSRKTKGGEGKGSTLGQQLV